MLFARKSETKIWCRKRTVGRKRTTSAVTELQPTEMHPPGGRWHLFLYQCTGGLKPGTYRARFTKQRLCSRYNSWVDRIKPEGINGSAEEA
jgi:hypothetical protein